MKTINIDEISRMRMVAGNERRLQEVIHDGVLKRWIGFGWIDLRAATKEDKERYPVVVAEKND